VTDASRRIYLALGRAFVGIGAGVALASLLDRALGWGFFRGSPIGTAAFLVVIGALLLWTVSQADRRLPPPATDEEEEEEEEEEEAHP